MHNLISYVIYPTLISILLRSVIGITERSIARSTVCYFQIFVHPPLSVRRRAQLVSSRAAEWSDFASLSTNWRQLVAAISHALSEYPSSFSHASRAVEYSEEACDWYPVFIRLCLSSSLISHGAKASLFKTIVVRYYCGVPECTIPENSFSDLSLDSRIAALIWLVRKAFLNRNTTPATYSVMRQRRRTLNCANGQHILQLFTVRRSQPRQYAIPPPVAARPPDVAECLPSDICTHCRIINLSF